MHPRTAPNSQPRRNASKSSIGACASSLLWSTRPSSTHDVGIAASSLVQLPHHAGGERRLAPLLGHGAGIGPPEHAGLIEVEQGHLGFAQRLIPVGEHHAAVADVLDAAKRSPTCPTPRAGRRAPADPTPDRRARSGRSRSGAGPRRCRPRLLRRSIAQRAARSRAPRARRPRSTPR